MKAILEFNIPEERVQLGKAFLAADMFRAADVVDALLRNQISRGDPARDREVMQECREKLAEIFVRM